MNIRLIISTLALITTMYACAPKTFQSKWTREKAPAVFHARFETSKGSFEIEVTRMQSPLAADRLYQLIHHHYFDNVLFYRVVPEFVAQFGQTDSLAIAKWEKFKIPDEPLLNSNLKGTISFARAEKETRGTQIFINLKDNIQLDTLNYAGVKGFPVFGKVISGMDVVSALYNGYGNNTLEEAFSPTYVRQSFLVKFPKVDSIKRAYLIVPNT